MKSSAKDPVKSVASGWGKSSIKTQLIVTFLVLIAIIFGLNLVMNNFFLEKYYIHQKQNELIAFYQEINEVEDYADYQGEEFEEAFSSISGKNNVDLIILYPESDVDGEGMVTVFQSSSSKLMYARVQGYLLGLVTDADKQDILLETDKFRVQRFTDSVAKMEYLEAWGKADNGCYFLMRIPIQSIRDSVAISNRFSFYIIIIGVIVAVTLVWWWSGRLTKPIKELTAISSRMANLEFDAKYTSGGGNEIGELGENFNHMSATLEKTISELKTANNELQNDLEQKKQVDEMRKEFISNVSHELKTPIALVQGYAEGLKECINDDEQSRDFYCDVIMDEASKMNKMVKKLLTLNQLESGADAVNIERFDITELLGGVIQSSMLLAEQKNAQIRFEQKKPVYVWGDEFKVEEVITNYISNALNHVDGEKIIRVTMEKSGGKTRVAVFNTGKNIPQEDLDKIWIKFYKVDKARTREYGGNGIGLSIVKAIMDSMHQGYGVVNCPDGVMFWFELDSAS